MADLDIYVESVEHFNKSDCYTLGHLLPGLGDAGLSYRVLDRLDSVSPSQCAFMHIDLTNTPEQFHQAPSIYPRCINGKVTTIDRRIYSRAIIQSTDNYSGPVISKSVLNHKGRPEFRYNRNRNLASRLSYRLRRLVDRNYKNRVCPPYRIYNSKTGVPDKIWSDPSLIVEKFIPGSLELPVTKYRYNFFFDCSLNTRTRYNSLLCKSSSDSTVEVIDLIPDGVLSVRKQLHLDFGGIDYFINDGGVFVIDANKTVSVSNDWINRVPSARQYLNEATDCLISLLK